jgi:regulatory protein
LLNREPKNNDKGRGFAEKKFCAYQPRCRSEARHKLLVLGLQETDRKEILEQLVKENHLSGERFACYFSRGRFRIKKWGREKM